MCISHQRKPCYLCFYVTQFHYCKVQVPVFHCYHDQSPFQMREAVDWVSADLCQLFPSLRRILFLGSTLADQHLPLLTCTLILVAFYLLQSLLLSVLLNHTMAFAVLVVTIFDTSCNYSYYVFCKDHQYWWNWISKYSSVIAAEAVAYQRRSWNHFLIVSLFLFLKFSPWLMSVICSCAEP